MKNIFFLISIFISLSVTPQSTTPKSTIKQVISDVIRKWHKAAADADFDRYYSFMADDAIFIGTDPTENWSISEFKAYSKPYFDRGKAWTFGTLERNIYILQKKNIAWFDELLDTQMGICRGSGIMERTNDGWKVKHYVLSLTIPNENVTEITKIKEAFDTKIIKELRNVKN